MVSVVVGKDQKVVSVKKQRWHSSHTGSDCEAIITASLEAMKVRFTKEKVAHSKSTAKTSKGLFDYRIHLKDHDHCIEAKTNQNAISIPNGVNVNPNIKSHQLKALREAKLDGHEAGFILNYRRSKGDVWVYLSLDRFDKLVFDNFPVNSINYLLAQSYGVSLGINNEILDLSGVIK